MREIKAICAAVFLLAGCAEQRQQVATDKQPEPNPPVKSAAPTKIPQLDPVDIAHTRTNVSTRPRFVFSTSPAVEFLSSEIIDAMTEQGQFVSATGSAAVAVAQQTDKGNPNQVTYSVEPSKDLAEDTWYWLVVSNSKRLRVGPKDARWNVRFYTSSAPHIVHLQLAKGNLHVALSEAVDATTVDGKKLLHAGGAYLTGCVLLGEACASGSQQWVSAFNVSAANVKTSDALELDHVGAWQGSARSFAEIPASAKIHKTVSISSTEWYDCQDGAARCWDTPFDGALPSEL